VKRDLHRIDRAVRLSQRPREGMHFGDLALAAVCS
jgi:hypothetical protein